jgi:hydroxycarboxylate dehydrogenase B
MDQRAVAPEALRGYIVDVLRQTGARRADAALVADSLVSSNLAGHDSHGAQMLPYYLELIEAGRIDLGARAEMVLDRDAVVLIDGHFGFGQVIATRAATIAVQRARKHGISAVFGRNANHIGRLGEYTATIANAGQAALLFSGGQGGDQNVSPFGGLDRRLTNNPISLAAPGPGFPALLDIALGVVAEGKLWLARSCGDSIPEGWIVDREGGATTDPEAFFDGGSLLPLGGLEHGHKGHGLIVLTEILAGILSGGGVCRPGSPPFSNDFLLIAVNLKSLRRRRSYDAEVEKLRTYVKSSRLRDGFAEILFPGEFERQSIEYRMAEGIPLPNATRAALADVGRRVGAVVPAWCASSPVCEEVNG